MPLWNSALGAGKTKGAPHVRTTRWLSVIVVGALIFTQFAVAAAAPQAAQAPKVKSVSQGQPFCPAQTIVNNKVAIKRGNCYVMLLMRDTKRTYLAFASRDAKIPAGQIVRLDTPAGAKLKQRILYRIPIKISGESVPPNSLSMVAVKVEDFGTRVSLTLSTPAQDLLVMFSVRK